jgi:hypothetical protein
MLIRRVEAEERWADAYEALPLESLRQELSHLRGCADYDAVLGEVIELAAQPRHFHYRAARLFRDLAPLDMAVTERLLRERLERGNVKNVELVADLIGALPGPVVTGHVALVAAVLRVAHAAGGELLASVKDSMRRALVPTRWESVVGEPDPNQVEALNRARELAASLPVGSLERKLFDDVSASIGRTIKGNVGRDEEWLDE